MIKVPSIKIMPGLWGESNIETVKSKFMKIVFAMMIANACQLVYHIMASRSIIMIIFTGFVTLVNVLIFIAKTNYDSLIDKEKTKKRVDDK